MSSPGHPEGQSPEGGGFGSQAPQHPSLNPQPHPQHSGPAPGPTNDRRAHNGNGHSYWENGIFHALIRGLAHDVSVQSLEYLLYFTEGVVSIDLLASLGPDGKRCAVVGLDSWTTARNLKAQLEGRPPSIEGGSLSVDILPQTLVDAAQQRRTASVTQEAMMANPALVDPYARSSSELPAGRRAQNLQNIFSPLSPIGNHLAERVHATVTTRELINGDSEDTDDASDLIRNTVAYGQDNASAQSRRRAPGFPLAPSQDVVSALGNLSLDTAIASGPTTSMAPYATAMYPGQGSGGFPPPRFPGSPHRSPGPHLPPSQYWAQGNQQQVPLDRQPPLQQHQAPHAYPATGRHQMATQHPMIHQGQAPAQSQAPFQAPTPVHNQSAYDQPGLGQPPSYWGPVQQPGIPGQQQQQQQQPMPRQQPMPGQQHSGPPYRFPAVNPADQNPPCNTLYVGNLHMGTTEEELKGIFSKQRGYKRMLFRQKPSGPMCFVEFESITFATKALTEQFGRLLKNKTKGGIRLSFSKNPLGVRSSQPHHSQPSNGGMGHGMMNGFTSASGPPPGLTAPPGFADRAPFDGFGAGMAGNGADRQYQAPAYSPPPISPPGLPVPAYAQPPPNPSPPVLFGDASHWLSPTRAQNSHFWDD